MKRIFCTLAIATILAGTFCMAATVPAKTELTFSGSYVNPDDGSAIWQVGTEMLFPVSPKGILVLGPAVAFSSVDENTGAGASIELNFAGKNVGPFIGASGLYFLDSFEDQADHSVDARAGLKIPISDSGLFKVYVSHGIDGRSKEADLTGALAAIIRF